MQSTILIPAEYMIISNTNPIRVTGEQFNNLTVMVDAYLKNKISSTPGKPSNLISTIKVLRRYVTTNSPRNEKLGLRDSKLAVERLADSRKGVEVPNDSRPKIVQILTIHSVIVDFGEGKVEIDLDELQMRGLASINEIGISDLTRILDLVETLKEWTTSSDEDNHEL